MREGLDSEAQLVVEERFAIVPEWLLDADVGDCAVRLYAVLLRYGNSSGARMPGRATLARRLHKKSTDTVDRAMRELVATGAVHVEHRFAGRQRLTNRYHVQTTRPRSAGSRGGVSPAGGRMDAATGQDHGGCDRNGSTRGTRVGAARVAARFGQDPKHSTESTYRPVLADEATWDDRNRDLLRECAIEAWPALAADVRHLRAQAGGSVGRWQDKHLLAAIELAVRGRGWPADHVPRALRQVAADPVTRSPGRLAEAGPWWDQPVGHNDADLEAIAVELDAADGRRVALQREARAQLEAEGRPVTRASVLRRAHGLLRQAPDGVAT